MKYFLVLYVGLFILGCSTAQLIDTWKNPEIDSYEPNKILIIGMTSNNEAREKYEQQLKQEFESRGIESTTSLKYFDSSFLTESITEEQISQMETTLIENGFDTILLTKIIGVEDKEVYSKNFDDYDVTHRRFKDDYLIHQDILNNPQYYNRYKVFHSETSMYCICPSKDRELLWKGYIDIIDPEVINKTVTDYVSLIITVLEEQSLINSVAQNIDAI